jgi:uncharacterized protein YkwD
MDWKRLTMTLALTTGCEVLDTAGGDASAGGSGGDAGVGGSGGGPAGGTGGSTPGRNPLTGDEIAAFVRAHNEARGGPLSPAPEPSLRPVTWDDTLAEVAFAYASRCEGADRVLIDHNAQSTDDYRARGRMDSVGENIWATSGDAYSAAEVVDAWMSEAPDFDYANNTSSGVTGHYTQVVWRSTERIGCAWVQCPEFQFPGVVLCNYAPAGNDGSRPY